jgi:hypothetical protein
MSTGISILYASFWSGESAEDPHCGKHQAFSAMDVQRRRPETKKNKHAMNIAGNYLEETMKSFHGLQVYNRKSAGTTGGRRPSLFRPDPESESVVIIMKHMAGNMCSRFTGIHDHRRRKAGPEP